MNDEATTSAGEPALGEPALTVLTAGVSPEELAAVTAVVDAAVAEELAELHDDVQIGPSVWERSQRALRTPLQPGPGAWQSYGR